MTWTGVFGTHSSEIGLIAVTCRAPRDILTGCVAAARRQAVWSEEVFANPSEHGPQFWITYQQYKGSRSGTTQP